MNTFKKTGGFTLVELIIVIAILAILSSVAVAGYSSYIKTANDSAVETFLNDMKTHIALANAKGGAVSAIKVDADGTVEATVDAVSPDFVDDFEEAYGITAKLDTTNKKIYFQIPTADLPQSWSSSNYSDGATWGNNQWNGENAVSAFEVPTSTPANPANPG